MKLRHKTLVTLIPLTIVFILLTNYFATTIIVEDAIGQDVTNAQKASEKINIGIQNAIGCVDLLCSDWGMWDDAWYFVQYGNDSFSDEYMNVPSLIGSNIDIILFYNISGSLVDSFAVDVENATEVAVPVDLISLIDDDPNLMMNSNSTDGINGILSLQAGCIMFSSKPVIRSDDSGPVMGTIFMLRHLDQDVITEFSLLYDESIRYGLDLDNIEMIANMETDDVLIEYSNESFMSVSWLIPDFYGQPAISLDLDVMRVAYVNSQKATGYMISAISIAGLLNFILVMVFVDRGILLRLNGIRDDITKIGTGEREEHRVRVLGNDEIKDLSIRVNLMLESIERSQDEISMKEKRYRIVVEGSSNAIFIVDIGDDRIIEANPAFMEMTGFSTEDVGSMNISDILMAPEPLLMMGPNRSDAMVQEEYGQLVCNDGSTVEVDISGSRLIFEGREVVCYIAKDVTERKRAERERELILGNLKKTNEKLDITLRSIDDGVITTDISGNIILANRAAEVIVDRSMDEMLGRKVADILDISDYQWDTYMTRGSGGPITSHINDIRGKKFQIEFGYTIILDDQNNAIGSVFVFRDISERTRAEIAEANADRLESIGTLAGGIAHDFNNIMTSVMGELYLLRGEIESGAFSTKRPSDRIGEIETAIDRGKFVAQQLLSLSKGGAPIQKPTGLVNLIRNTARLAFTGSSMKWTMECPDDLWVVNIDAGQMNRALLNILLNAQEAIGPNGHVKIVARNFQGRPPGNSEGKYVVVDFIDDGSGIPPDVLPRIFDPYFTTKEKGTGLGMTIIYSTIKRHGGTIEVSSELGIGTKVTIYIPAMEGKMVSCEKVDDVQSGSGRILIMDDEEPILEVTSEVLQELGYAVDLARDGHEALRKYREAMDSGHGFDVVIMDLTIKGGMGGKETIPKLLEMDPEAKAIVSSGYSNDPVMASFKDYGFVAVVPKPYSIGELSRTLKKVLDKG